MTSEPDSKPGRRPPTIELTATEVNVPASSQANGGAAEDAGSARPNSEAVQGSAARPWWLHAISGVVGAATMAVIGAGLWYAGLTPPRQAVAPPVTTAPSPSIPDDIAARLDKIEAALKAPLPESALEGRLAATEVQAKSLGESVSALRRRIDDVAATAQMAQKSADAATAAADMARSTNQTAAQRSDLAAVTKRIAALEAAANALAEQVAQHTSGADDRAVRLTIVAEALRDAAERGAPFQAELAAVKSLGADQDAISALEPFAANGIPNAAILAHELATSIPALRQASDTAPPDATFLGKLEAHAQKLVHITPVDAPVGNEPSAVVTRLSDDAGRGDIAAALRDIAALPDTARTLVAAWIKKAEARNAALAASRQIAADALASLGKTATQ